MRVKCGHSRFRVRQLAVVGRAHSSRAAPQRVEIGEVDLPGSHEPRPAGVRWLAGPASIPAIRDGRRRTVAPFLAARRGRGQSWRPGPPPTLCDYSGTLVRFPPNPPRRPRREGTPGAGEQLQGAAVGLPFQFPIFVPLLRSCRDGTGPGRHPLCPQPRWAGVVSPRPVAPPGRC